MRSAAMSISESVLRPYLDAINSDDTEERLLRLVVEFKNRGGTHKEAEDIVCHAGVTSGVWGKHDERDATVEVVLHCIGGYRYRGTLVRSRSQAKSSLPNEGS